MKDFDLEERVNRAVQNFEAGYNCAQSVFLAYSDIFELDMETAKKMSVSFGGGVGRMREICGTVSAMAMLAGFNIRFRTFPIRKPAPGIMQWYRKWLTCSRRKTGQSSAATFCLLNTQQLRHRHRPPVRKNIIRSALAEDSLEIRLALQEEC